MTRRIALASTLAGSLLLLSSPSIVNAHNVW
jgi:hypothetical protein